jgi:hypothetical protein
MNFDNLCPKWSYITPVNKTIDLIFLTFGMHQHSLVVHVLHKAAELKLACLCLRVKAISNAMHFAFYDYLVAPNQFSENYTIS